MAVAEFGPDRSLAPAVDEAIAAGADALAVAGGDGSLARVAHGALAHDLPFVCIPAGTRNHFARDLGLDPADPMAALDALTDGVEGLIDVGEVNGRVFLNNVSLGIYAEAIRQAGYRDAKVRTLLETARPVFGSATAISAPKVGDDLGLDHEDPTIVLVSNNPYGARGAARSRRAADLERRPARGDRDRQPVAGRPPSGRVWSSASLRIDGSDLVHAGIDGEAVELAAPLEFAARPTALRVRTPRRARGGASGRRSVDQNLEEDDRKSQC